MTELLWGLVTHDTAPLHMELIRDVRRVHADVSLLIIGFHNLSGRERVAQQQKALAVLWKVFCTR